MKLQTRRLGVVPEEAVVWEWKKHIVIMVPFTINVANFLSFIQEVSKVCSALVCFCTWTVNYTSNEAHGEMSRASRSPLLDLLKEPR